jgi:hypothetical protein
MVEQSIKRLFGRARDHAFGPKINAADMGARRQHGHDDIGVFQRIAKILGRPPAAARELCDRVRRSVEPGNRHAGAHQVERHRAAHVAKADECNCCHGVLPWRTVCRETGRAARPRARSARRTAGLRPQGTG